MIDRLSKATRVLAGGAALALALTGAAPVVAQEPTAFVEWGIWIDPDGCMHWWADGQEEGYMIERVDPVTGLPVCLEVETCMVQNTDTLFDTDSAHITPHGREYLRQFFTQAGAFGYAVYGHTDSRASDEYNIGLSQRRADAVADVARSVGAVVEREIGFGERMPIATNDTAEGMALNRRVEVICYRW